MLSSIYINQTNNKILTNKSIIWLQALIWQYSYENIVEHFGKKYMVQHVYPPVAEGLNDMSIFAN
jgi:hypothetical protein